MRGPVSVKKSFTRPANATAYTSGDLVANSTTAASVVALKFATNTTINDGIVIRRAKLQKSGTTPTAAAFRLHLWNNPLPVPTNGDNGALAISALPGYLGYIDFDSMAAWADGCVAFSVPEVGSEIITSCDGAIYGLLEARDAYTPASAEVFTVQLELLAD